jgi:hypothetical protein
MTTINQEWEHQWQAVAGQRALITTRPQQRERTNNKSMRRMMTAPTKRARVARAMVMAIKVAGDKEGKGGMGDGISNKGGVQQRG